MTELTCPAHSVKMMTKAAGSDADEVILDLEDSCGLSQKVAARKTLIEALNVDEDQVTPQATLQGDLGAESIDFLDIVFRLEREFGIKIPRGELFPESIFQGDSDMVQDGKLTSKGLTDTEVNS